MVKKLIFGLVILLICLGGVAVIMVRTGIAPQKVPGTFWLSKRFQVPSAVYYCPMHPTYTSDRPGDCPICNMKLVKKDLPPDEAMRMHEGHKEKKGKERKIIYYRNPMGQPDISPVPKKDSMGMDYVPVYEDEDEVSSQASPAIRELTLKELMAMKPGEICLLHKCKMGTCMIVMTEEFARLGKCPHCGEDLGVMIKDLAPAGYADVKLSDEKSQMIGVKTAPVTKTAMTKTIRTVGRIAHDPELYQAEEEYVQAVESLKKAEASNIPEIREQAAKLVASSVLKLKLMGLSSELIEEIEEAGAADRSLLHSEAGMKVWLYAPIYEYEIPLVKIGDSVEVEAPAISGKKFQGVIRAIDPVLDPMTRTVRVRAVLDNPEGHLKHEMYVNARLQIGLGELLTVPEEAVFATGEKNIIFVAKPNGVFEPREVEVGASSEGRREIKSGIAEGETVVVSGNFLIDSESRLKGALEGMGAGGHQHGQ